MSHSNGQESTSASVSMRSQRSWSQDANRVLYALKVLKGLRPGIVVRFNMAMKGEDDYANTWKASWSSWCFLTGAPADIHAVASCFGMDFWNNEGFLTHTFHTVIIDRDGRLAANLEGNHFTASQLGDLVETVLHCDTRVVA